MDEAHSAFYLGSGKETQDRAAQAKRIRGRQDTGERRAGQRAMKYATEREYADPEKAARKLLEIANTVDLLTLDHSLIAKPSTRIESLGDAIRFLATLTPEVRAQPHWYRAIHSVGAAVNQPRYITVATLNLQTALAMDDRLLLSDLPASLQPPEQPIKW
jgi:hypothetical protein